MNKKSVTSKNTKAEILEAYDVLRKEQESSKQQQLPATAVAAKKQEEKRIVEKTVTISTHAIEDDIQKLRRSVSTALDDVLAQLMKETETLQDVRQTIAIEQTRLTEVKNITLADDALQLLLSEYDTKEKELKETYGVTDMQLCEDIAKKKRDWEREQEEYVYQLSIDRKKEEDAHTQAQIEKRRLFEEEMKQKEADLDTREDAIQKQETELTTLREAHDTFSETLRVAVDDAKQLVLDERTKEFATEKRLLTQQWSSEKELLEVRIANLQETIGHQYEEISSLKSALASANDKAQNLASTVVEHMSGAKFSKQQDAIKGADDHQKSLRNKGIEYN